MKDQLYEIFKFDSPLSVGEKSISRGLGKIEIPDEFFLVDPKAFIGIEIEVEKVDLAAVLKAREQGQISTWNVKEDGSLRNNGIEFISLPLRGDNLLKSIVEINKFLNNKIPNHEFSKRTSSHIHLNVRSLSIENLFSLVFLYQLFESTIFRFIDSVSSYKRSGNIFCTELNKAKEYIPLAHAYTEFHNKQFADSIYNLSNFFREKRYSALNLAPVRTFGTVEFRHMHGTADVKKLVPWINIIQSLRKYAMVRDLEKIIKTIEELNTNSQYHQFLEEVFGRVTKTLLADSIWAEMESGAMAAKEIIYKAVKSREILKTDRDRFFKSSAWEYLKSVGYEEVKNDEILVAAIKKRDILMAELYKLEGQLGIGDDIKEAKMRMKKELAAIDEMINVRMNY